MASFEANVKEYKLILSPGSRNGLVIEQLPRDRGVSVRAHVGAGAVAGAIEQGPDGNGGGAGGGPKPRSALTRSVMRERIGWRGGRRCGSCAGGILFGGLSGRRCGDSLLQLSRHHLGLAQEKPRRPRRAAGVLLVVLEGRRGGGGDSSGIHVGGVFR